MVVRLQLDELLSQRRRLPLRSGGGAGLGGTGERLLQLLTVRVSLELGSTQLGE